MPRPVAWAEAEPVDGWATRSLPGVIRPVESAALSFEVAGHIAELEVDIGDAFQKGDILARLDPRTHRLRLRQSQADLNRARATAAEAALTLQRVRAILKERATTQAEFDRAKAEAESSESQVQLLKASVALARENLRDTVLVAPYNGRITRRLAEPAQRVSSGQSIIEVEGAREGLEVQVSVPETLVGFLELGSQHRFRLPSRPAETHTALLTNVAADSIGPHVFPAFFRIEEPTGRLRSGLTTELDLRFRNRTHRTDGLTRVPISAVVADTNNRSFVYVIEDSNSVSKRSVVIEELSGDSALLSSGLTESELVVTKGAPFLQDGQSISRLDAGIARYNE